MLGPLHKHQNRVETGQHRGHATLHSQGGTILRALLFAGLVIALLIVLDWLVLGDHHEAHVPVKLIQSIPVGLPISTIDISPPLVIPNSTSSGPGTSTLPVVVLVPMPAASSWEAIEQSIVESEAKRSLKEPRQPFAVQYDNLQKALEAARRTMPAASSNAEQAPSAGLNPFASP